MTTPAYTRAVLVVDDEPGIRAALTAHFSREGWRVTAAGTLREAEYRLAQHEFDLLVSDVRLPDGSGVQLLRTAREAAQPLPAIFLTAFATVPDAVEAMRSGASDYLIKPVAWPQLRALAGRLLDQTREQAPLPRQPLPTSDNAAHTRTSAREATPATAHGWVGNSAALLAALARARAAAGTDADILIEGEAGTGKKHLARFLHEASARAHHPFVVVPCAMMPAPLLEDKLFGSVRSAEADAFRQAQGGTLVLDGIDAMPLALQPKLLRVLQTRKLEGEAGEFPEPLRLRVIATAAPGLASAVDKGSFRADLYYRLNVIPLTLPPLRERPGDLPLLAAAFAQRWAARTGRAVPVLTPDVLELLEARSWPANVRELGDALERALSAHALAGSNAALDSASFLRDEGSGGRGVPAGPALAPLPPGLPIRQLERLHLEKTLALTEGNRTRAAELLGISLRTVRNKIREYGLPPRKYA